MSHQIDVLPFPIGSTMGVTGSTDQERWEGREFLVEDLDYSTATPKQRAAGNGIGTKRVRIVRNVSGINLLPRYLVSFSASKYGKQVDGYTNTTAAEGYPVDEFLPAAGVVNNDLFYIVVEGPAECYTSAAANAEDVFSQKSVLVALTAAASTFSTTAGRVTPQDLTGATALLANQVQNRIGVAMSASTTANSNSAKLCYIKKW
jgi:hypothetical protein